MAPGQQHAQSRKPPGEYKPDQERFQHALAGLSGNKNQGDCGQYEQAEDHTQYLDQGDLAAGFLIEPLHSRDLFRVLEVPGYALAVPRSHHCQHPPLFGEKVQIPRQEGIALVHQHIGGAGRDLTEFGDHLADDIILGDAIYIDLLILSPAKSSGKQGPDQSDLVQQAHGRPEALDGDADVPVHQGHPGPRFFCRLNGRQHLRARLDSHLLAHLSLNVGQEPLHQKKIELAATEKLADLDLPLLLLPGDGPVAGQAQLHSHYIRPQLLNFAHHLLNALLRDMSCTYNDDLMGLGA